MTDSKQINEMLFDSLSKPGLAPECRDAINEWTRDRMWSTWHIPNRFYIPEMRDGKCVGPGLTVHLKALYAELRHFGKLRLDHQGNYACLTGKKPVLIVPNEHGPWVDDDAPAYEPFRRVVPQAQVTNAELEGR